MEAHRSIPTFSVGSVWFTVALLHGSIFFRRPDLEADLWFALMALAVAGGALAEPWVYSTTTVEALEPGV